MEIVSRRSHRPGRGRLSINRSRSMGYFRLFVFLPFLIVQPITVEETRFRAHLKPRRRRRSSRRSSWRLIPRFSRRYASRGEEVSLACRYIQRGIIFFIPISVNSFDSGSILDASGDFASPSLSASRPNLNLFSFGLVCNLPSTEELLGLVHLGSLNRSGAFTRLPRN